MSIHIKILKSPCCNTSESIEQELKTASENADVPIQMETLSDLQETMKYGISNFPSLVIDDKAYSYNDIDDLQTLEQIFKEHSTQ